MTECGCGLWLCPDCRPEQRKDDVPPEVQRFMEMLADAAKPSGNPDGTRKRIREQVAARLGQDSGKAPR